MPRHDTECIRNNRDKYNTTFTTIVLHRIIPRMKWMHLWEWYRRIEYYWEVSQESNRREYVATYSNLPPHTYHRVEEQNKQNIVNKWISNRNNEYRIHRAIEISSWRSGDEYWIDNDIIVVPYWCHYITLYCWFSEAILTLRPDGQPGWCPLRPGWGQADCMSWLSRAGQPASRQPASQPGRGQPPAAISRHICFLATSHEKSSATEWTVTDTHLIDKTFSETITQPPGIEWMKRPARFHVLG